MEFVGVDRWTPPVTCGTYEMESI